MILFLLQKRAETSRNLEWFLRGRSGAPSLPHFLHRTCQTIAPCTPCMVAFLVWTQTLWFHRWPFTRLWTQTTSDLEKVSRLLPLPLQTMCTRLLPLTGIIRTSHPRRLQQHRKRQSRRSPRAADIDVRWYCEIPLSFIYNSYYNASLATKNTIQFRSWNRYYVMFFFFKSSESDHGLIENKMF